MVAWDIAAAPSSLTSLNLASKSAIVLTDAPAALALFISPSIAFIAALNVIFPPLATNAAYWVDFTPASAKDFSKFLICASGNFITSPRFSVLVFFNTFNVSAPPGPARLFSSNPDADIILSSGTDFIWPARCFAASSPAAPICVKAVAALPSWDIVAPLALAASISASIASLVALIDTCPPALISLAISPPVNPASFIAFWNFVIWDIELGSIFNNVSRSCFLVLLNNSLLTSLTAGPANPDCSTIFSAKSPFANFWILPTLPPLANPWILSAWFILLSWP